MGDSSAGPPLHLRSRGPPPGPPPRTRKLDATSPPVAGPVARGSAESDELKTWRAATRSKKHSCFVEFFHQNSAMSIPTFSSSLASSAGVGGYRCFSFQDRLDSSVRIVPADLTNGHKSPERIKEVVTER